MKHVASLAALVFLTVLAGPLLFGQQEGMTTGGIEVVDARLGKAVENRELLDEAATFGLNERVYLWMKVAGASGDSITVTWKHGEYTYSTTLGIGGSPWRTWAYKTAAVAGDWTVAVTDMNGNALKEMSFSVTEAMEAMPPTEPPKQQ